MEVVVSSGRGHLPFSTLELLMRGSGGEQHEKLDIIKSLSEQQTLNEERLNEKAKF